MEGKYCYFYDTVENKFRNECTLNPTEVPKTEAPWLWARNTKYFKSQDDDSEDVDHTKVGKWMIFVPKAEVNTTWSKVKEATKCGNLWTSKVSTFADSDPLHVIIIYTKDYTDLDDVINVLDCLESSGIKPPNTVIRYKTDQQTMSGVYSSQKQKASIYDSKTIKQLKSNKKITDFFKKTP